jgi:restriction endonuclease
MEEKLLTAKDAKGSRRTQRAKRKAGEERGKSKLQRSRREKSRRRDQDGEIKTERSIREIGKDEKERVGKLNEVLRELRTAWRPLRLKAFYELNIASQGGSLDSHSQ